MICFFLSVLCHFLGLGFCSYKSMKRILYPSLFQQSLAFLVDTVLCHFLQGISRCAFNYVRRTWDSRILNWKLQIIECISLPFQINFIILIRILFAHFTKSSTKQNVKPRAFLCVLPLQYELQAHHHYCFFPEFVAYIAPSACTKTMGFPQ